MSNHFRDFSSAEGHVPAGRAIDDDAPQGLRQEFVDLVFHLGEHHENLDPARLHRAATQSLGMAASGQPYGGFRYALGRDINRAPWPRVYDVMVRLWPDFDAVGIADTYRDGVNRILAGNGVAWDMGQDGRLHRVMNPVAQASIDAAARALSDPRFVDALRIFNLARDAYDDRPRRDRDAVANAFDALESVAKTVYAMPAATFYDVLQEVRRQGIQNTQVTGVLESINTLRNRNFGHGVPFTLRDLEVEFTYTVCVAGIVLLAR